jgi:aldose 1-epimerase
MAFKRLAAALSAGAVLSFLGSAVLEKRAEAIGNVMKQPFGKTDDGTPVDIYTLKNKAGMEARITNYGGIVVSLKVPDRKGSFDDVVLGYDNLDQYVKNNPFFGALVGRYGNRIAKAQFTLDGKTYHLAANNGPNSLHGGLKGFDKKVWQARELTSKEGAGLELLCQSKDGEEGYPGNLTVKVNYLLGEDNALRIDYLATTDKDTVLNLTNHSYFNLAGAGNGDILGHVVMIAADKFTPVDETLIPTGVLQPVKGTPFDFTTPTAIGARINQDDQQLKFGKGYDHNWVLNSSSGTLALAVRVTEPTTGRIMEVLTTEPGVQFYVGNFLDGSNVGKGGKTYKFRYGFCLETQHFPDSPNQPAFPSTVLKPGQQYKTSTVYRFSAK